MTARNPDRIFNRDGWRHYRRTYSMTEVRIGVVILGLLASIAVWVAWRGVHPDPELFSTDPALLAPGADQAPERSRTLASSAGHASEQASGQASEQASGQASGNRGPVPTGLAAAGWREQSVSSFDSDNLYKKIDGREGYYKAFGFQMLYVISLAREDDETATVDIEMYDQGTLANALGAYVGERQPDAQGELSDTSIGHVSRNALFMVRGRYYVRAVGSDETEPILAQLAHVRRVLEDKLASAPLPWGYGVFAGQMGMDPGKISFVPENAFSFGFASQVFTVEIDEDGAELFAVATASPDQAAELSREFVQGFKSYGETAATVDGVEWIEDRYLQRLSGTMAVRSLVIGVYSAADLDTGKRELARLRSTAESLSDDVLARAAAERQQAQPAGDAHAGAHAGEPGSKPVPEADEYGAEPGSEPEAEPGGAQGEPSYPAEDM